MTSSADEPIVLDVPVNDPTFDPETEEVVQYRGEPFPRIRPKHLASSDPIDPLVREYAEASASAVTRALVYVSVDGGIADVQVLAGDVDIVLLDWDNIGDAGLEDLADYREQAEGLIGSDRETALALIDSRIESRKDEIQWSREQTIKRAVDQAKYACELLGIAEGSPAWQTYIDEAVTRLVEENPE